MSVHSAFIETPISSILKDACVGLRHLKHGAASLPLSEYILQSLFMKMTGFQEQKCKCIAWEIATVDYDYRYNAFKSGLGECSTLDDKCKIVKALRERIPTSKSSDNIVSGTNLLQTMQRDIDTFCKGCERLGWFDRDISIFKAVFSSGWEKALAIHAGKFFDDIKFSASATNLIGLKSMAFKKLYEDVVYRHRNRCAHNTTSYQGSRSSFAVLSKTSYDLENYLVRFGILILIDDIMRELFGVWLSQVKSDYL